MVREEPRIFTLGNLEGGGRNIFSLPNFVPFAMGEMVFSGLVCGICVENFEADH